jgi:hypothetical protein
MSVRVSTLFPEHNDDTPLTLSQPTDTRTPQNGVPILFVHSMEQPFCSDPSCLCQQNRLLTQSLLTLNAQGAIQIESAARVLNDPQGGSDARS